MEIAENVTASEAVTLLCRAVNRGGRQRDVAEAIGAEHGYLVNQVVYGVALGVVRKCRFALGDVVAKSCGEVMYPLAIDGQETREQRGDHPYHDGELTCNAVRGALVTLNAFADGSWRRADSWVWQ